MLLLSLPKLPKKSRSLSKEHLTTWSPCTPSWYLAWNCPYLSTHNFPCIIMRLLMWLLQFWRWINLQNASDRLDLLFPQQFVGVRPSSPQRPTRALYETFSYFGYVQLASLRIEHFADSPNNQRSNPPTRPPSKSVWLCLAWVSSLAPTAMTWSIWLWSSVDTKSSLGTGTDLVSEQHHSRKHYNQFTIHMICVYNMLWKLTVVFSLQLPLFVLEH